MTHLSQNKLDLLDLCVLELDRGRRDLLLLLFGVLVVGDRSKSNAASLLVTLEPVDFMRSGVDESVSP